MTDSEDGSEDSENLPWGMGLAAGSGRKDRDMGEAAKGSGFAVVVGRGSDGRKRPGSLHDGVDVRQGARAREGGGAEGDNDDDIQDEDEADEDIHARWVYGFARVGYETFRDRRGTNRRRPTKATNQKGGEKPPAFASSHKEALQVETYRSSTVSVTSGFGVYFDVHPNDCTQP